jgi:hypothetical protein
MKLFTIGDSVSQGFMSLAAARTDLSSSTLLASKLGLESPNDYRFPDWEMGGIPLNVENIMRRLNRRYGSNIRGVEWFTVLQTINDVVDQVEDYYERGEGRPDVPYGGGNIEFFHNVAVRGFNVADAWQVTPNVCRDVMDLTGRRPSEGYLTGPDNPFYRTALKVLNPSLDEEYDDFSQISWLEEHATGEGIENLVLWLGANNALGTVIDLKIHPTLNNPNKRPFEIPHKESAGLWKWNLWHPDDFKADYEELLRRVDSIMQRNTTANWNVFIGTVPLVTIAPLAKGVGETTEVDDKGLYYKYYTYFPFEEDFARETGIHLNMQDALHIDDCIREYNKIIRALIEDLNPDTGATRYHVVDVSQALQDLAYKRNNGQPRYEFPGYFDFIYPKVNTKYYHADVDGQLKQGGLFSLDGIHPTAIGHGLIAYEFLKVMKETGVVSDTDLDWSTIFANDTLYAQPINLMQELYGKDDLAKHIVELIKLFKD